MQVKMAMSHYMVEGRIPIDPKKQTSEIEEEECAVFSFPETMVEGTIATPLGRWSATSLSAVTTFLASEGVQTPTASIQAQQSYLNQFNVYSNPEILKHIGKFCLKSKQFSDLAVYALKEYLTLLTYSKMFTFAAG